MLSWVFAVAKGHDYGVYDKYVFDHARVSSCERSSRADFEQNETNYTFETTCYGTILDDITMTTTIIWYEQHKPRTLWQSELQNEFKVLEGVTC